MIGLAPSSDVKKSREELAELRSALPRSILLIVGGNDGLGQIDGAILLNSLDAFADWATGFSGGDVQIGAEAG